MLLHLKFGCLVGNIILLFEYFNFDSIHTLYQNVYLLYTDLIKIKYCKTIFKTNLGFCKNIKNILMRKLFNVFFIKVFGLLLFNRFNKTV